MTSVVAMACNYAIEMWNMKRIAAHVIDDNKRSSRVLEKNRFQREVLLCKYDCKGKIFIDTRVFVKISD
jgi:RimJ/RimL family protein N-acetyltransferase